jgi:hypothetical protein
MYAFEEKIQSYNNKRHEHSLKMSPSRLIQKLRITSQTQDILDYPENFGRIVFEKELANKKLRCSR